MMKKRMMKMVSRFFVLALTTALVSGVVGCGMTEDEERAMLDAEREFEASQQELINNPVGGLGFDMDKCIEDCKKENENDGTIGNLDVYCKTRCKFRDILSGAGLGQATAP
jgi:hypothetical protein